MQKTSPFGWILLYKISLFWQFLAAFVIFWIFLAHFWVIPCMLNGPQVAINYEGLIAVYLKFFIVIFWPFFVNFLQIFWVVIAILWYSLPIWLVFWVFFLKFKMVIYQGLQLGNNFGDLNDILAISWQFLAVYLVFFCCSLVFFAISGDIQGNFLPDLSNLEVNYIESTIIYQAVLFP